ncbi:DUF2155 domain-containing protein [Zavarzinia compransoris]|uniref:DUF2155 domain-containing protein n=1 Tax=Zavarzinia compransoris TaxID=1264899 RepID=A0A317ECM4_9PROT|nr:DUF2155 domain-containing protein [Zavarzinia compransoris]PWR24034.1 DUF2155 domain-containing protein [Zavarzinia compransoris]TDP48296.1 hypothetical protein DES42_102599 [Zavarzinia compransoris]
MSVSRRFGLLLAAALAFGAGPAVAQAPEPAPSAGDAAPPAEDIPSDVETPARPGAGGDVVVPPDPASLKAVGVTLQGLDKVTGRTSAIEVPMDGTAAFGTLIIRLRQCITAPADEKPETSAFLEITDQPPGQTAANVVFSGWMFASSPALSALEHPVYDVWVSTCRTAPH